jgi:hypothetical protein
MSKLANAGMVEYFDVIHDIFDIESPHNKCISTQNEADIEKNINRPVRLKSVH